MSDNSSSIDADDLDVEEGAIIQSVQSSVYESVNPVQAILTPISSESPESVQATSKTIYRAPIITEKKKLELCFDELSPIEKFKPAGNPVKSKNFLQKNIDITKAKPKNPNIDSVNISDLCLEEEKKNEAPNVDERFYKYQHKVNEKVQNLAKELKDKEMENCTFKPDVKSDKQRRTSDQFIHEMMSYEKIKKDKLDALRMHKNDAIDPESYRPVINQKSKEMIAKKKGDSLEPIYEKLYKSASRPTIEKSPPKVINLKPSIVKRPEPVDKILYEDALRRAAKNIEQKPSAKESAVNSKSHQVLAAKFSKEFQEVLSAFSLESENISKESALQVLLCLNFIRNNPEHAKFEEEKTLTERFFKLIGTSETVSIQALHKLSLAVLNIYIPAMTLDYESEGFSVHKEEVLKIHKIFSSFYENRQLSKQVIKEIKAQEYSFKPQINPGSEAIAKEVQKRAGSLCSLKREEFLQREKKKAQEKIEKIKKDQEDEQAKVCTFKPNILKKSNSNKDVASESDRGLSLYEKSKLIKERKELKFKSGIDQEIEKDMSECTFAPRIEKIKVKEERDVLGSKSVQQQIMRMQKAREEQERKKNILERNMNSKPLQLGVEYTHKSKSSFKPPLSKPRSPVKRSVSPEKPAELALTEKKMEKSQNEEEEEIQLEVKLPNGSQKTLIIPPGSDKELKLSMFILENKLSEEMGAKLRFSVLQN